MKRYLISIVVAVLVFALVWAAIPQAGSSAAPKATATPTTAPNWVLVWSDEFDGTQVNTTNWTVVDHTGDINNELHYDSPDNVTVSNGNLVIRSDNNSMGGRSYTSGKVLSRAPFIYGKVEIRSKVPQGRGLHAANWLLHYQALGYVSNGFWPPEFDILEVLGHQTTTAYQSVHYSTCYHCRWPDNNSSTTNITVSDASLNYHVYGIEWTPSQVRWYIDGVLKKTWNPSSNAYNSDEPMRIILDTAVGGNWPGDPDATTVFPAYHYVDYVRVYQDNGVPITPEPTPSITPIPSPTATPNGDPELVPVSVVASTEESATYSAAKVIDNNATTRWSSEYSDPQWITMDLGAVKNVTRVILNWEASYGKDYLIQVSDDNTNWTTILTVAAGNGGIDDLTGLNGSGRYVRMYGTARALGYGYSLWEMDVYGYTGAPQPTNTPANTPTPTKTPTIGPSPTPTNTPIATNTPVATATLSNTNLALNKACTSSSQNSTGEACGKALDASLTTYWRTLKRSSLPSEWMTVDLGASQSISRVVLKWHTTSYATAYTIQISEDGANWSTVATVTSGAGGTNTHTFAAASARYVKLDTTVWKSSVERNWLYEFEIYP